MSSQIKKINLLDIKKNSSLVKTNNPFESFIYLQAMENSNSASQKTGWVPEHLGEVHDKKIISFSGSKYTITFQYLYRC